MARCTTGKLGCGGALDSLFPPAAVRRRDNHPATRQNFEALQPVAATGNFDYNPAIRRNTSASDNAPR